MTGRELLETLQRLPDLDLPIVAFVGQGGTPEELDSVGVESRDINDRSAYTLPEYIQKAIVLR